MFSWGVLWVTKIIFPEILHFFKNFLYHYRFSNIILSCTNVYLLDKAKHCTATRASHLSIYMCTP